jgi:hypothetical protein
MLVWCVLGLHRDAHERNLMCKELILYERSYECTRLWLHQQTNLTRLISVEPNDVISPNQPVSPTRNISLPVLQEGMDYWNSGVQHLVCLMLKYLTVAVYETVILKFFKAQDVS